MGGQPPISFSISTPSLSIGGGATTLTFAEKMLDLRHPRTKHVFGAARLEDEIRICLVAAKQSQRALQEAETIQVLRILEELDALNTDHFASDAGIASTIEGLRSSVRGGDTEVMWSRFLELAETPGKNFGTWAI